MGMYIYTHMYVCKKLNCLLRHAKLMCVQYMMYIIDESTTSMKVFCTSSYVPASSASLCTHDIHSYVNVIGIKPIYRPCMHVHISVLSMHISVTQSYI